MSNTLISLSDNMVQTVAAAGPAVVSVYGRRRMPASGIVWASGDGGGIIVTAHHVLRSSENLSVGLADGHQLAATLVGRDPSTDLAILRVDATDLTPAGWHDTPRLASSSSPWAVPAGTFRPPWASSAPLANAGAARPGGRSNNTCKPTSSCTPASPAAPWSPPTASSWG